MTDLVDSETDLFVNRWHPERLSSTSRAAKPWTLVGRNAGKETALWSLSPDNSDARLNIKSALEANAIDHACARIRQFKRYEADWDGEGALAPASDLLDAATLFLRRLQPWHPSPSVTLDKSGRPVIELRDDDTRFFGKIRFVTPEYIEMFAVCASSTEAYLEGDLASPDALKFLSDEMQITLRP